jgi:AbrB family looped-hinge helix DNA binding protein
METTIDRFGRVLIPKRVRDDLGLQPGTVLQIEEVGQSVQLKPLAEANVLAEVGGILVFTGRAVGDVAAAAAAVRAERLDDLAAASLR